MRVTQWLVVSLLAAIWALPCRAQSSALEVRSPDQRIVLRFAVAPGKGQTGGDGQLVY